MNIEEVKKAHLSGGIAKCEYDSKRIDWLLSEHDRLTAGLSQEREAKEAARIHRDNLISRNHELEEAFSQERAKREEAERFTKELTVGLQTSRKMRGKAEFALSAAREALQVAEQDTRGAQLTCSQQQDRAISAESDLSAAREALREAGGFLDRIASCTMSMFATRGDMMHYMRNQAVEALHLPALRAAMDAEGEQKETT